MPRGELRLLASPPPSVPREAWREGAATASQAAEFLGCSRKHVFALMARGELVWGRLGKARRIPRTALVDLLSRNEDQI